MVIFLSAIHPIACLHDHLRTGHTLGQTIVVGLTQLAMDITEQQDVQSRRSLPILPSAVEPHKPRHAVVSERRHMKRDCVTRPTRLVGHTEPRLPANDTYRDDRRRQECPANYLKCSAHQKGRSLVPSPAEASNGSTEACSTGAAAGCGAATG